MIFPLYGCGEVFKVNKSLCVGIYTGVSGAHDGAPFLFPYGTISELEIFRAYTICGYYDYYFSFVFINGYQAPSSYTGGSDPCLCILPTSFVDKPLSVLPGLYLVGNNLGEDDNCVLVHWSLYLNSTFISYSSLWHIVLKLPSFIPHTLTCRISIPSTKYFPSA